jgi:predicted SAM-dependent methyltransferase
MDYKNIKKRLKNLAGWIGLSLNHCEEKPPVFAKKKGEGLRIHIGCGDINIQGWINVDARPAAHVHLITNSLSLDQFADGCAEEIYLCHILEHFAIDEINHLLELFNRKLAPEGIIRISVPSFDALLKIYESNSREVSSIQTALMGGQDYEYNFHKTIFNENSLRDLLTSAGFQNISSWNTLEAFGSELRDWSSAMFTSQDTIYPLSLNLKGEKAHY